MKHRQLTRTHGAHRQAMSNARRQRERQVRALFGGSVIGGTLLAIATGFVFGAAAALGVAGLVLFVLAGVGLRS